MTNQRRRLDRLERGQPRFSAASRRFAARVAAHEGVDAEGLIADTARLLDRAAAAGMASTVGDLCAFYARETGEDPARVLAETEAGVAAWRATVA